MVEHGHVVPARRSSLSEDNWELRWPRSVRTFAKMSREDAQTRSVLKAVTLPILRTPCRINPNGADPAVVQMVAEDLRLPVVGESSENPSLVTGGRVAFAEHLPWALKCLTFGHAFFEKVYTDGSDGPQRLRKLAPRLQDTISDIKVARDGGLESITQKAAAIDGRTIPAVELGVNRLLAYVYEPESFDWVGTSILRSAYKHWVLKDELLRLEQMVLERNGMGIPVLNSSDDHNQEQIDANQEVAEGLRSGEYSGVSLPQSAKLEIAGVKGQLTSPRAAIDYHDSQIARAALAHALNLEGKGGSYSLAEVQMDMFIQSLQTIADFVAVTANKYLVEDMVEKFTGERRGPFPMIQFDTIDTKKALTPDGLAALKNSGVIIPDSVLEEHVRRQYELPPKAFHHGQGSPSAAKVKEQAEAAAALVAAGVETESALEKAGLKVADE